jgi:hypothetical protein
MKEAGVDPAFFLHYILGDCYYFNLEKIMNIEQAVETPIEDPVVAEVGAEPIENNNPIEDLLKAIETQDYTSAESQFNDLIGDRLQDTLDQAKVRIASGVFNGAEESEEVGEEEVDYDFTDEEDFDNAE